MADETGVDQGVVMEGSEKHMDRRDALKRGAALGGAVAWAIPTVQAVGMTSAFAQFTSPIAGCGCIEWFTGEYNTQQYDRGIHCEIEDDDRSPADATTGDFQIFETVIGVSWAIVNCADASVEIVHIAVSGDNVVASESPVGIIVGPGQPFGGGLPAVDPNLAGHLVLEVTVECEDGTIEVHVLEVDFACATP